MTFDLNDMTSDLIRYLQGLSLESWTTLGTFALVAATLFVSIIAWVQIGFARTENRITQTLIACGLYDTSPVIFECCQTLNRANDAGRLFTDAHILRLEIMTILNFLDAIAIGVEQKLYVKDLVRNHMQSIIARHVSELIESPVGLASGCTPEHFPRLLKLNAEWAKKS